MELIKNITGFVDPNNVKQYLAGEVTDITIFCENMTDWDEPVTLTIGKIITHEDLTMLRAIRSYHGNQNYIHNTGFYPFLDKLCKKYEKHLMPNNNEQTKENI
jgi:hypothetical protein